MVWRIFSHFSLVETLDVPNILWSLFCTILPQTPPTLPEVRSTVLLWYMDFLIVLQCRRLLLLFKDTCLIMKYNHVLILRTEFLLKLRLYPIKRLHILKQQETGEPDQSTSVSKQNMRKLIWTFPIIRKILTVFE